MDMKYKRTDETKVVGGITLHRIECVTAFADIKCGEKGGWIESEKNLSQRGDAWVCENAWVYDNAKVGVNSWVYDNAKVGGNARISGNAEVDGDAWVGENAMVCENADYIVFKNWWSSGRYFTWTRSNNKWRVGCFYGSGEELIAKAYNDSEKSGREYERVVRYVESILTENNNNNK